MKLLRTALVDDEPPARRKLRRLLDDTPDTEIVGEAASGREALELIQATRPNLLFLDIQLPDMNGFDVLRFLGPRAGMHVVFVTAFDHHAVRAFDVQALDYLLKPVAPSRFAQMMERVRERLKSPAPIALETSGSVRFISPAQIRMAESARNYVLVHVGGEAVTIRSTLEAFSEQLDPDRFVRINRSQLLNLEFIREVKPVSHGDYQVVLSDGSELSWSRRYSPRSHLSRFESR